MAAAIKRCGDGAGGILEKLNRLKNGRILSESRALNQVGMTCEVFCDAVDNDVDAKFEGLLETGRGEGVIDYDQRAAAVRNAANGRNVVDEEAGIGRRFDPDELRA
jgi:hypothetical protein